MPITAGADPATLEWRHFTEVPSLTVGEDAHIDMNFEIPNRPIRRVDGQLALNDNFVVRVTPRARVKRGANRTAALLAHEQGHYNIGFLAARTMARALEALRAPDQATLRQLLEACFRLHTNTRLAVIQARYDTDTGHGTNATQQTRWDTFIATCMGSATCTRINGLDL
jgi:hypothetical protein